MDGVVAWEEVDCGECLFETFFEQVVGLLEAVEAADDFYPLAGEAVREVVR